MNVYNFIDLGIWYLSGVFSVEFCCGDSCIKCNRNKHTKRGDDNAWENTFLTCGGGGGGDVLSHTKVI